MPLGYLLLLPLFAVPVTALPPPAPLPVSAAVLAIDSDGETLEVEAAFDASDGSRRRLQCRTPCTLHVPPGDVDIESSGLETGKHGETLRVAPTGTRLYLHAAHAAIAPAGASPPVALPDREPTHKHLRRQVGEVLLYLGLPIAISGAATLIAVSQRSSYQGQPFYDPQTNELVLALGTAGGAVMAASGLMLLLGTRPGD
jgi:hypothetical protein